MKTFLATSAASALLLTSPVVVAGGGPAAPPPGSSAQLNVGSGASPQLNVGAGASPQLNVGSGAPAQLNVGSRPVPEGDVAPGQLNAPALGELDVREPDLHFDSHPELHLDPPRAPDAERHAP